MAEPAVEPAVQPAPGQEEFTVFYRNDLPAVTAFLLYLGASLPDAADVAQEAMTEAYQKWSTIKHPKTWVRTVASRKLIRRAHTVHESPAGDIPEPTPLLPSPPPTAEWEERHDVLRMIALLPYRQRQVMAWAFDGYRPAEIADILGLPSTVVRRSLCDARKALANHLRAASREDEDG
jgi:RNA polymerase sigma-70 factor (ECF subfamily)